MRNNQLKKFVSEIERRGGETTIEHMPYGRAGWKHVETRELELVDTGKSERKTVHLLGCEGWRYYSRNFGSKHATLRYLVGTDDSGSWAVRVPGTCESVSEAVKFVTPAIVVKARAKKRRVLRQGNLYLVESPRSKNYLDSNEHFGGHEYYKNARVILHSEHQPLLVPPGRWRAVSQKSLETNRGAARD